MKKINKLACILLLAFSSLYAFDGERKGFILGGGIGTGFLSNTNSFNSFSNTDSRAVFLTSFKIGYAPSNTLEIYFISKVSWWGESDRIIQLGLSAIAITVYFDNTTETGWFISGGLGYSTKAAPFESTGGTSYGLGLFGGGGYKFLSHWNLEVDLLYSTITTNSERDFNSFGVLVTVNFLAF